MLNKVARCPFTWFSVAALLVILVPSCVKRAIGQEVIPTPADPVVLVSGNTWAFFEEIPPLIMPLVDPLARDNTAEDIIRHVAQNHDGHSNVRVYILVGLPKEVVSSETDRLLGGMEWEKRYVVSVPQGYKLFGKYRLLRTPENPRGQYQLYPSVKFEKGGYTKGWRLMD